MKEDKLDNEIVDKLLNARNQLKSSYTKDFEKLQKQLKEIDSST